MGLSVGKSNVQFWKSTQTMSSFLPTASETSFSAGSTRRRRLQFITSCGLGVNKKENIPHV